MTDISIRPGESIPRPWRDVCSSCLALLEETEERESRGKQCAVCGVELRGKGHCIPGAAAEECHRLLAARIAKSGRIKAMHADNVLVLMDWLRDRRHERTSAGGIILPASEKPGDTDSVTAMVIAAGPGWYDEKIIHNEGMPGWKPPKPSSKWIASELRAGDRVLVDRAISGDPFIIDGVEFRIVREENVLGVIEEAAE